jgi:glycosyltransferase involved in cell wall biosynthesis
MYNGFQELYKDISPKKYQLCLGGFNVNNQYQFLEMLFTNGYKNINPVYRAYLEKYLEEGNDRVVDESYKRLWAKDVFHYGGMYNELDVCLVPLCENNFNSYKSQIKIIEAGWFKKPVIVSNVMPYTLDCTNRSAILVSPNKRNEGWGSAIKSLILNPSKREDLAEALHEHVKAKYDMDVVNVVRHQLYQSLCE